MTSSIAAIPVSSPVILQLVAPRLADRRPIRTPVVRGANRSAGRGPDRVRARGVVSRHAPHTSCCRGPRVRSLVAEEHRETDRSAVASSHSRRPPGSTWRDARTLASSRSVPLRPSAVPIGRQSGGSSNGLTGMSFLGGIGKGYPGPARGCRPAWTLRHRLPRQRTRRWSPSAAWMIPRRPVLQGPPRQARRLRRLLPQWVDWTFQTLRSVGRPGHRTERLTGGLSSLRAVVTAGSCRKS